MLDTDQIVRARYVISEAFLSSKENPFLTKAYQDIGYPFSVGFPRFAEELHGIAYNHDGRITFDRRGWKSKFSFFDFSSQPEILRSPILHAWRSDYFIYRQPNIQMQFEFDVDDLKEGAIQRPLPAWFSADGWHADEGYGDGDKVLNMLSELRVGSYQPQWNAGPFQPTNDFMAAGLTRVYAMVLWDEDARDVKDPKKNCSTEFRHTSGEVLPRFQNREMFHWLAEDHRCTPMTHEGRRVFFRAFITPEAV
jgi:hypothetical protein